MSKEIKWAEEAQDDIRIDLAGILGNVVDAHFGKKAQ